MDSADWEMSAMGEISKQIGERIRFYRKLNGMKIEELAKRMFKSSATLSKYERGSIVMDVETLYQAAEIFQIAPSALMAEPKRAVDESGATAKGIFQKADRLYLYWAHGTKLYDLNRGILEWNPAAWDANIFACVDKTLNKNTALAVYEGKIVHTDIFSRIVAVNPVNSIDYVVMHVRDNLTNENIANAMLLSIINRTFEPCALPMLVCRQPQTEDADLMKRICVEKATQAYLKKRNCFRLF